MTSTDPYSVQFWWAVGLAMLVLIPLKNPAARKWALAGVNLSFFVVTMTTIRVAMAQVAAIVVFAILAHGFLKLCAGPSKKLWSVVGAIAVLVLFVDHKLPWIGASVQLGSVNSMLVAIGFSYVALRLLDSARGVYEGRHAPPDLPSTINYLLPFHMLAAGPIQAYDEFALQPAVPAPLSTWESLGAMDRIARGVFKKYVLAQGIQQLLLTGFHARGLYFLFEVQLTYIWLYLDFSAYSDIAVGVGRMIGVATPENFNRPYFARSVIDFWERWHISLSQFIRRNIFIPIQMSLMRRTDGRAPLLIAAFAFFASFLFCGLWHQIGLAWLAWGVYQATGLIVCTWYRAVLLKWLGRKGLNRYLQNPWFRLIAIFVTFEFAAFGVALITYPFQELTWPTSYLP